MERESQFIGQSGAFLDAVERASSAAAMNRPVLVVGELIELREAAERLGVHYMTAYRHVRTGRLPAVQRGGRWYMDLDQNHGERVNLDPKVVSGTLNVVANMPTSSSACSVGGTSNLYQLDVCTAQPLLVDSANHPIVGRTLSNTSAAVGFIIVRLPNGALKLIATTADGKNTPFDLPAAAAQDARKAGWRRVRD